MSVSDEEMLVVRSVRQSFEMFGGASSAVQASPNPFFITLTGQFDLLKAAQLVITNLDAHRAHKAKLAQEESARHLQAAAKELAAANVDLA